MPSKNKTTGRNINGYTPARLVEGAKWYVEFYAYDPELDRLGRKRLYVPKIKPVARRRCYANDMVLNINSQLREGWNPFLSLNNPKEYALFKEVCENYYRHLWQMTQDDLRRKNTYNGYTSMLNQFMRWNTTRPKPVVYVYQLKTGVVNEFLDWIWIEKKCKPRTRDNYLKWLHTFFQWMKEKMYISENPAECIGLLQGRRKAEKNRTVIPQAEMARLKEYLQEHNPYFLLACYVLYYCLIRPREMSYMKIGDISVRNGTVAISGTVAKNKHDAIVTIPDGLMKYMIDLKVLEMPADWYLFSWDCKPGKEYRLPKYFCDHWAKVARALKFPPEYKFYSLKDTGITDLIKDNVDLIAVRDQARHHDLSMTDLYTPMMSKRANETIRHRKTDF